MTIRSKNNPQKVITSIVSQDTHVFSIFDHIQEAVAVADKTESVFLKTENAIKNAYCRFINSTMDSANEAAGLNSQKTNT